MNVFYTKIKKYLKSLFITLCYMVAIIGTVALFIMMSGEIFRCIMVGLVIFIILPALYYFIDWLFKEE